MRQIQLQRIHYYLKISFKYVYFKESYFKESETKSIKRLTNVSVVVYLNTYICDTLSKVMWVIIYKLYALKSIVI